MTDLISQARLPRQAAPTRPEPSTERAQPVDDSGAGRAMFLIFIAAVLIVTGAVALLALVSTWWMLGVAFAMHVIMTTVVVSMLMLVMRSRTSRAQALDKLAASRRTITIAGAQRPPGSQPARPSTRRSSHARPAGP